MTTKIGAVLFTVAWSRSRTLSNPRRAPPTFHQAICLGNRCIIASANTKEGGPRRPRITEPQKRSQYSKSKLVLSNTYIHYAIFLLSLLSSSPLSSPPLLLFKKTYVQHVYRCILESTRQPIAMENAATNALSRSLRHDNTKKVPLKKQKEAYAIASAKRRGKNAVKSGRSLEGPRRGAIGGGSRQHARERSASGGASSQENAGAGRIASAERTEGARKSSRRVALGGRAARILFDDSLGLDLDDLDFGDALDGLDDDGGLHDHDDGLRGH
jgi:hypothetical protein